MQADLLQTLPPHSVRERNFQVADGLFQATGVGLSTAVVFEDILLPLLAAVLPEIGVVPKTVEGLRKRFKRIDSLAAAAAPQMLGQNRAAPIGHDRSS